MQRTDRDNEILEALACRVRLFALDQIATAWWPTVSNAGAFARRRLTALTAAGWLHATHVHVARMLELAAPLQVWSPGEPDPDCAVIARRLAARWESDRPPTRFSVYSATRQTLDEFGGPVRPKRLDTLYATHDLNLAGVFLLFRQERPDEARAWIGEDLRPKAGYKLKDPDAVLQFADGRPELVVELGGKYPEPEVRAFHADCARRGRRYELW